MFFKKKKPIEKESDFMYSYWKDIGYGTMAETKHKKIISTTDICFEFDLENKRFRKIVSPFALEKDHYITLKELQAINKQVEELRWKGKR